jgi:cytochrome c-type biogenesis protein CcmE
VGLFLLKKNTLRPPDEPKWRVGSVRVALILPTQKILHSQLSHYTLFAMKKSHILAIIIVAAAIGLLISASSGVTTFADFAQAERTGDRIKLVGQLVKDQPVEYDPEKDPNFLAFQLRDEKGEVRRVTLRAAKPQDFERSEQVVLTGAMNGQVFEAEDMLLKCPSKYQDQEKYIRAEKG